MKKIRITESDIRNIVMESVRRCLSESMSSDAFDFLTRSFENLKSVSERAGSSLNQSNDVSMIESEISRLQNIMDIIAANRDDEFLIDTILCGLDKTAYVGEDLEDALNMDNHSDIDPEVSDEEYDGQYQSYGYERELVMAYRDFYRNLNDCISEAMNKYR